jgi:hypothetical protein
MDRSKPALGMRALVSKRMRTKLLGHRRTEFVLTIWELVRQLSSESSVSQAMRWRNSQAALARQTNAITAIGHSCCNAVANGKPSRNEPRTITRK